MATAQDDDGSNQPEPTQTEESLLFEIDGELYQINVGDQTSTQVIQTEDEQGVQLSEAVETQLLPSGLTEAVEHVEHVEETVVPQEMTYITLQLPESSEDLPTVVESLDPDAYSQLGITELVVPPAGNQVLDTSLLNQPGTSNMVSLTPGRQWQHLTLNQNTTAHTLTAHKRPPPSVFVSTASPRKKHKSLPTMPTRRVIPTGGELPPDFEVVERGSAHGQSLLIDAQGYCYTFKKSIGNVTHWRCSVRNTKVCKASVVQIGSFFHMHKFKHDHEPNPTQRLSSKVIAKLKHIIRLPQYKFRGTADIVREVLQSFASMEHIDRLNKSYLDRIVSRERQNLKNLGNGKKPWETDSDLSDSGENASDLACATLEVQSAAVVEGENTYEILSSGWHGRFPLLADQRGFSYIFMKRVGECAFWQCPEHKLGTQCPVFITEEAGSFILHGSSHIHPAQPEKQLRRKFRTEINNEINKIKKNEVDADLLIETVITKLVTQNIFLQDKMPRLRRWAQKNINKILQKCIKLQTDEVMDYFNVSSGNMSSPASSVASPVPPVVSELTKTVQDSVDEGQWELLPHGTQKGGELLIDPQGCLYTPGISQSPSTDHQVWRCTALYNHKNCENIVVQKDNVFHHGFRPHHHPVDPRDGLVNRVKAALLNTMHKDDLDEVPIHEIVNSVVQQMAPGDAYLARRKRMLYNVAHRKRAQTMKMKTAKGAAQELPVEGATETPSEENQSSISEDPEDASMEGDTEASISDIATSTATSDPTGVDYEAVISNLSAEDQPTPEQMESFSTEDPDVPSSVVPDYEILDRGSNQGQPILIDGHGYVYALRQKTGGYQTYWRCNIRNKRMVCFASVTQTGSTFRFGSKGHIHPANPRRRVAIKISTHLKEQLRLPANNHKTAGDLVREALALYQMHDLISHLQPMHLEKMVMRERHNFHSGYNRAWELESDTDASDDMCENPSKRLWTEKTVTNPADKNKVDYQMLTRAWRDTLPLVVDSNGYHYALEKKVGTKAYWGCPFKVKGIKCSAVVIEEKGVFHRELPIHQHAGKPYKQLRRKFKVELRATLPLMRHQDIPVDMIIEETMGYVLQKNPTCNSMISGLRRWAQKVVPGIVEKRGSKPEPPGECEDALGPGVEYEVIQNGTQRGGPLLLDKHGNCYCVKVQRPEDNYTLWRCTKRSTKVGCEATVSQTGTTFKPNHLAHNHDCHPQRCIQRKVRAALSQVIDRMDMTDMSATEVVEETLAKFTARAPWMQSKKSALIRMANRRRRSANKLMGVQLVALDGDEGEIEDPDLTAAMATIEASESKKSKVELRCPTVKSGNVVYPELMWREGDPEFEIVPRGTQKGQNLLLHKGKYAYTMRPSSTRQVCHTWICSVRNSVYTCPASVKQEVDGTFTLGKTQHCHPGQPEKLVMARACSALRDFVESSESRFMRAVDIVKAIQDDMAVKFSSSLRARLRKMANHLLKKTVKPDTTLASHIQKLSKRLSKTGQQDLKSKQQPAALDDTDEEDSDDMSDWEESRDATRLPVGTPSRSSQRASVVRITKQEGDGLLPGEIDSDMEEENDVEESQVVEQWEVPLEGGVENEKMHEVILPSTSSVEDVIASNIDILVEATTRALAESTSGTLVEYSTQPVGQPLDVKLDTFVSKSGDICKSEELIDQPVGKSEHMLDQHVTKSEEITLNEAGNRSEEIMLDEHVGKSEEAMPEDMILDQPSSRSQETVLGQPISTEEVVLDQFTSNGKGKKLRLQTVVDLPVITAVIEDSSQVSLSSVEAASVGSVETTSSGSDVVVTGATRGRQPRGRSRTRATPSRFTHTIVEPPEEWSSEQQDRSKAASDRNEESVDDTVSPASAGETVSSTDSSLRSDVPSADTDTIEDTKPIVLPVITALRRPSSRKSTSPYKTQALQKTPSTSIKTPTLKSVVPKTPAATVPQTPPKRGTLKRNQNQLDKKGKGVKESPSKRNKNPQNNENESCPSEDTAVEVRVTRKRKCDEPVIQILLPPPNSSSTEQQSVAAPMAQNTSSTDESGEEQAGCSNMGDAELMANDSQEEETVPVDSDPHGYKDATFYLLPHGSNRGMPLLIDSFGYSYTTKVKTNYGNLWRCSVRSKTITCNARVSEHSGSYVFGKHAHNHSPKSGMTMCPLVSPLKEEPVSDGEGSGNQLSGVRVESEVDMERLSMRLMDMGKRLEPKGLHFRLDETLIPYQFVQKVVDTDKTRYIILATESQLEALATARTWYIDVTMRVIRSPFVAMLGIQTYFKSEEEGLVYKPLVYCIMSSTNKKDYKKVFQSILSLLPEKTSLLRIVAPFERSLWHALWKVLPQTPVYGCSYLYRKAIAEKISELGLLPMYKKQGPTSQYLQKVLALPLVPAPHIPVLFTTLQSQARSSPLEQLMAYVDLNFITDMTWPVTSWCCYNKPLRSSKEAECWYPTPQGRSNTRDPFYQLILRLYKLSRTVTSDLVPLTQKKVCRYQQKGDQDYTDIHGEWAVYAQAKCTAGQLLTNCSQHIMAQNI